MFDASTYEKLGVFYLGHPVSPETGESAGEPFLYDSKDLTTHAFCVGMTGSGKTGLCVTLLEEAAIDGIPAIAIDPKGDLGNLALTFPNLRPKDFRPWIDESEAARNERTPDEQARWTANLWKKGLTKSGQSGDRIRRFKTSVETTIYTPGSRVGRPLRVLGTLDAPPPEVRDDPDALRDRVVGTTSSLLTLLGIEADPVQSREHIVLSRILSDCWEKGEDLDLGSLIRALQNPSFDRVGVIDLESYFPAKERFELATTLNNLLASPGFESWMEGEPLDAGRLLYTEDGKPRLSILSIAHLSERERMFFVTLLLGEVVSWMRSQEGTGSLRALLFMDEVFGYFPPLGNPPAKPLMLTLLKQARAYGVGVVLATQNPVDIDYKGLSNCGTWFLGRLQTERDKARVLEGLESASAKAFDRAQADKLLSTLGKRVFLMNNVHEDGPALFETRWALSYLRGPLQRDEIRSLTTDAPTEAPAKPSAGPKKAARPRRRKKKAATEPPTRPLLPKEADEGFLVSASDPPEPGALYEPGLFAEANLHYVRARGEIDHWETVRLCTSLPSGLRGSPWRDDTEDLTAAEISVAASPVEEAEFEEPAAAASNPKSYARWSKMLASHLYKERPLTILQCKELRAFSRPGESEAEFRRRLRQKQREQRDEVREKLDERFRKKMRTLTDRKQRAEARVDRERAQYENRRMETVISWGTTLLGAVLGRKVGVGTARSAASAAKGASRTLRERGDVGRAEERVEAIEEQIAEWDREYQADIEVITEEFEKKLDLDEVAVRPRKSDLAVTQLRFVWRA